MRGGGVSKGEEERRGYCCHDNGLRNSNAERQIKVTEIYQVTYRVFAQIGATNENDTKR